MKLGLIDETLCFLNIIFVESVFMLFFRIQE